jgi:hypothetical protein
MNLCLSFLEIGEAIAPSWVWSWGHSVGRQSPMVTRVLLALAVLAIAFLTLGSGSRPVAFQSPALRELSRSQLWEEHHQPQDDEKSQVKEFKGKISKIEGRFVLEESSDGGTYGTYLLDDQTTASKYEGQRVTVTGTLDAPHKTIRVRKIEAVA